MNDPREATLVASEALNQAETDARAAGEELEAAALALLGHARKLKEGER